MQRAISFVLSAVVLAVTLGFAYFTFTSTRYGATSQAVSYDETSTSALVEPSTATPPADVTATPPSLPAEDIIAPTDGAEPAPDADAAPADGTAPAPGPAEEATAPIDGAAHGGSSNYAYEAPAPGGPGSSSGSSSGAVAGFGPSLIAPPPPPPQPSAAMPPPPTAVAAAPAPPPSAAGDDDADTRFFPWPPPKPSELTELPRPLLAGNLHDSKLGDVAARLENALQARGYVQHSYYAVPGGFALATQPEQIAEDGASKPESERWSSMPPQLKTFADYLTALFTARKGYYRIIVFIVTPRDVVPSSTAPTEATANDWSSSGVAHLPAAIAARPFTTAHIGTALIYEYAKSDVGVTVLVPGRIPARKHLERAGLWAQLSR